MKQLPVNIMVGAVLLAAAAVATPLVNSVAATGSEQKVVPANQPEAATTTNRQNSGTTAGKQTHDVGQLTTEFKYLPRAEDFVKVYKSIESLSFPGWEITAGSVIDVTDQAAGSGSSEKRTAASSSIESDKLPLLKEFCCDEYLAKTYINGQEKITLEVCRFDSPAGAYGAYTCFREGASTVIRRGDGSSEDDGGISFWQHCYLVLLRASGSSDDESKIVMRRIADQITLNIEKHAYTPAVLSELPFMDRVAGSEHVFMGPLAAHMFSPVHLTNDPVLDRCIIGATADYQIAEPFLERLKVMLIGYKDPPTAYTAYRQLISDICPNCGTPQADSPTIFKLSGRYAWCQLHGTKLGVISNGRRAVSVAMLGHQFNW